MKVAVPVVKTGGGFSVSPRLGRAEGFLVFREPDEQPTYLGNSSGSSANQGAGIAAAKVLSDDGVTHLTTTHCGPKAFKALVAAGISVFTGVEGTPEQVSARCFNGELSAASEADTEAHW
jgi:predicted Fe-Mo cluster-binding NifX family protein